MTRRELFCSAAAASSATLAELRPDSWWDLRRLPSVSYDWIKPGDVAVTVDGVDVTSRCFAGSTHGGQVECYIDGGPETETIFGKVEVLRI